MNLNELRQKRAALVTQARAIMEKAQDAKRVLENAEETQYDALMDESDKVAATIARVERLNEEERVLALPGNRAILPGGPPEPGADEVAKVHMASYRRYIKGGLRVMDVRDAAFMALQSDSDTAGGYLNAPQMAVAELIKAIDNNVFVRQLARTFSLGNADSLGAPVLDTDVDDADWTSELATGSLDSAMAFGKRELQPHPLAKRIKVSRKLLRTSAMDVVSLVNERLAYKFGVSQEKGFMTGTGSQQPLGLFTANTNGISTGRDVSTGNTSTAIGADNLMEVKYSVKEGHWAGACWIFHRTAIKNIRKLKDGNGQYLWQAGLQAGQPDMLLDSPIKTSEYAPSTFTTGLYVGLFGNLQHYWIADSLAMGIQRLDELYAETNQVGFIGRLETDGQPVLEEAFARVTLA